MQVETSGSFLLLVGPRVDLPRRAEKAAAVTGPHDSAPAVDGSTESDADADADAVDEDEFEDEAAAAAVAIVAAERCEIVAVSDEGGKVASGRELVMMTQ